MHVTKLVNAPFAQDYLDAEQAHIDAGWIPYIHDSDRKRPVPNHPFVYQRNGCHVWSCLYRGQVSWARADLIEGRFRNHKYFQTKEEALNSNT